MSTCRSRRSIPTRCASSAWARSSPSARAASNEPRLIVLRYEPPNATNKDFLLGLVGKAITFDTGGISIKPAGGMQDMKGDMAGGAGTLHGIGALAALGTPVRAIAILAAAENMPGGGAFRPGDILRAANGKTIEVINTDAEGRLVLADALWYARREGATHVLDLATLTGAMELALGDFYAGVFANDDDVVAPRFSKPAQAAATTRGRSRSIRATAATSTRRSRT